MSRGEIEELKDQVKSLRVRVYAQEDRIEELEKRLSEVEGTGRPVSKEIEESGEDRASLSSYSLVSERPVKTETLRSEAEVGQVAAEDREGRERLARKCGQFLKRALVGDFRGSSGRDRLRVPSTVYVICADYEGRVFRPALLVERFAEVKSRCKRGAACGRSVFLGFATRWEALIALEEGGIEGPEGAYYGA